MDLSEALDVLSRSAIGPTGLHRVEFARRSIIASRAVLTLIAHLAASDLTADDRQKLPGLLLEVEQDAAGLKTVSDALFPKLVGTQWFATESDGMQIAVWATSMVSKTLVDMQRELDGLASIVASATPPAFCLGISFVDWFLCYCCLAMDRTLLICARSTAFVRLCRPLWHWPPLCFVRLAVNALSGQSCHVLLVALLCCRASDAHCDLHHVAP